MRMLAPTLALFICALVSPSIAKADALQFNTNNFGQVGSLGSVTTTLVGNQIQVDVALNPAYIIHGAGVGFNAVGSGIAISNIVSASLFTADLTSHNFDGYGSFAYSVDSNQSTAQARSTNTSNVSFLVSSNEGFTSASQIGAFAAQVAPLAEGLATGFAVTSDVTETPEPATMLLLGSGLVGLAGYARRFKR